MSQRLSVQEEGHSVRLTSGLSGAFSKDFPHHPNKPRANTLENSLKAAVLEKVLWGATHSRSECAPAPAHQDMGTGTTGGWPGPGRLQHLPVIGKHLWGTWWAWVGGQ